MKKEEKWIKYKEDIYFAIKPNKRNMFLKVEMTAFKYKILELVEYQNLPTEIKPLVLKNS